MRAILRRTVLLTAIVALTAGTASAAEQQGAPVKRPKVAVIGTGGTISGVSKSRVDFQDYQSGKIAISELVGDLKPEVDAWDWLDKPVHALLFAIHCGLLALSLGSSAPGGRAWMVALPASGLYAVVLEALQIPVPGRYWEWWDVVADLGGAALGAFVVARSRARLRAAS